MMQNARETARSGGSRARFRLAAARFVALLLQVIGGLVAFGSGMAVDGRVSTALMLAWCVALAVLLWQWSDESALRTLATPAVLAFLIGLALLWRIQPAPLVRIRCVQVGSPAWPVG
jgi:hypothetical protein